MRAGARQIAKAAGFIRYFTGAPCLRGHVAERFVVSKRCVECQAEHRAVPENRLRAKKFARSYYLKNKDVQLEKSKAWEASPEGREKRRQNRIKNNEKIKAASRAWRSNNSEKAKQSQRKHYENNKGYYRARDRLRRAILADCGGKHSHADIETLWAVQTGECRYCKADLNAGFHVDHRMPIKLGGSNDPSNLQLLCPRCNRSKGAKHPDIYERSLGLTLTTTILEGY